jgi:hypothetical protein
MALCVFCGSRADSREHAWPVWLLTLTGGQYNIEWSRRDGAHVIPGPNPQLDPRVVCERRCNNGWMSRLETRAKPLLSSLYGDLSVPLDAFAQETIALWTVKTTMVLEAFRPKGEEWYFQPVDRHALRETAKIPDRTIVYVARYVGRWPLSSHGGDFGPVINGTHGVWGFAATLTLGCLAIHVMNRRIDKMRSKRGPWEQTIRQVWPLVTGVVHWPPPVSFVDDGGQPPISQLMRLWADPRPE